jgi:trimeric autotransporter adhesin
VELFGTGESRWLGITAARQQEMPRVLLASVPYAFKAGDAETLGGLPASAYVTTEALAASRGTTSQSTTIITPPLAAQNAAQPAASTTSATNAAQSAALPQATPTGSGTTNFVPLWTSSSTLGNSLLFQTGGKIGVGTTTPTETLDVNGNSIFRGSFQLPPGHDAIASAGYESHSFQFQASSYSSSTKASTTQSFGFRAEPLNNNTTNPSARLDLFFIPNGGSEFINTGVSWSSTGIMTFAPGQTLSGASSSVNEINLPATTSSTSGVITMGGAPILSNFGSSNIFAGIGVGNFTTTGADNTGFGFDSLSSLTTGFQNVAVGVGALHSDTTGAFNVAVGDSSLSHVTTGQENTAMGEASLQNLSTGSGNVAIGIAAGNFNLTGSSMTFLGSGTDVGADGLTNATAVGANAVVTTSNSMVLGSIKGMGGATVSTHVGIGTSSPSSPLHVVDDGHGAIFAESSLSGDNAVVGDNLASSGTGIGGFFYSASSMGIGVVGENSAGGLAGEFFGNVQVNGTLSKSAGSFKIDDPIDPANKYLSHSFVESPDMKNIYDGTVVTNAKGYAVVTLPDWFEALNCDFRYQLTPIGQFSQAMVASKIKDRKFTIRTTKPHVEISWQVTGIRHDAYADAHRIPTEEEKPWNEQGHYLHPELFGAPPDLGISTSAHADGKQSAPGNRNGNGGPPLVAATNP